MATTLVAGSTERLGSYAEELGHLLLHQGHARHAAPLSTTSSMSARREPGVGQGLLAGRTVRSTRSSTSFSSLPREILTSNVLGPVWSR